MFLGTGLLQKFVYCPLELQGDRAGRLQAKVTLNLTLNGCNSAGLIAIDIIISPTHKRTEGRAPVWGSEFTSKDAALQGGVQQKPLLG